MSSKEDLLTDEALQIQADFFKAMRIANAEQDSLRQGEIAARAGIAPSFYSEMSNLKKPLPISSAVRIADVFGLTLDYSIEPK